MISINRIRSFALAMEGVTEEPHFEKTSFRVNKKIFATVDEKNGRACLMLNLVDQSVFCAYDAAVIYPVPNKWGKAGATFVELKKVPVTLFKDAMQQAYEGKRVKKQTGKK